MMPVQVEKLDLGLVEVKKFISRGEHCQLFVSELEKYINGEVVSPINYFGIAGSGKTQLLLQLRRHLHRNCLATIENNLAIANLEQKHASMSKISDRNILSVYLNFSEDVSIETLLCSLLKKISDKHSESPKLSAFEALIHYWNHLSSSNNTDIKNGTLPQIIDLLFSLESPPKIILALLSAGLDLRDKERKQNLFQQLYAMQPSKIRHYAIACFMEELGEWLRSKDYYLVVFFDTHESSGCFGEYLKNRKEIIQLLDIDNTWWILSTSQKLEWSRVKESSKKEIPLLDQEALSRLLSFFDELSSSGIKLEDKNKKAIIRFAQGNPDILSCVTEELQKSKKLIDIDDLMLCAAKLFFEKRRQGENLDTQENSWNLARFNAFVRLAALGECSSQLACTVLPELKYLCIVRKQERPIEYPPAIVIGNEEDNIRISSDFSSVARQVVFGNTESAGMLKTLSDICKSEGDFLGCTNTLKQEAFRAIIPILLEFGNKEDALEHVHLYIDFLFFQGSFSEVQRFGTNLLYSPERLFDFEVYDRVGIEKRIADSYEEVGEYDKAKDIYTKILEQLSGEVNDFYFEVSMALSRELSHLNEYQQACNMQNQLRKKVKEFEGKTLRYYKVIDYLNLSKRYFATREQEKKEVKLKKIIKSQKKVCGKFNKREADPQLRIKALQHLSIFYRDVKANKKSYQFIDKALQLSKSHLLQSHPDALRVTSNYAIACKKIGGKKRLKQAELIETILLRDKINYLGQFHADTFRTRCFLVETLVLRRKWSRALCQIEDFVGSLERFFESQKLLGQEHPENQIPGLKSLINEVECSLEVLTKESTKSEQPELLRQYLDAVRSRIGQDS